MIKQFKKSLLITITLMLSMIFSLSVSAAPANNRLAGNGRYETSAAISSYGWSSSEYAIIATGENYPDALAAAPLAKKFNAPILLTNKDELNSNTSNELDRLKVKHVFIIGGSGVVSSSVENAITAKGIDITRLYGANRYETAVKIAESLGSFNEVVVTTGEDFADALSISPIAAKEDMPIILVTKDAIPDAVKTFLSQNNTIAKAYVLGNADIISDLVANQFPNVERIAGSDKYERNINIITKFASDLDFSNVFLATGENFPDALAGSALAPQKSAPIILTNTNPGIATKAFLSSKLSSIKQINILGGTGVVSDSVIGALTGGNSTNGKLTVSYIDVGQADSILVQQGDKNMLIDTGTNASTNSLMSYLQNQSIKKIDYLVLTHPHEDHIGGADAVIKAFDIGTIYMPKVTSNTKTFEDVVSAMNNKGLKATAPNPGDTFKLGDASFTILAPNSSSYDDLNDYSIVLRMTYGSKSFLFTGDAQALSESEILNKGFTLSADVLKVGHHGSDTSTSDAFLKAVNPKYAVISVGKGNDYGHPAQSTMDKLKAAGINVYRTDENGTIVATTDGNDITFNCNPGSYNGQIEKGDNEGNDNVPSNSNNSNNTTNTNNSSINASVDNSTPKQNTTVNLTVTGPAGATVTAVCHYKSKDTPYTTTIGNDGKVVIPIDIARASSGYEVKIDINVVVSGNATKVQTSFTPQ